MNEEELRVLVRQAIVGTGLPAAQVRAFFDSVETEKRGKALFEKAWPLPEALDRNEKRSSWERAPRS